MWVACRRTIQETGQLLVVYLLGSVGTVFGTLVAFKILPLASLGADSWKVCLWDPSLLGTLFVFVCMAESVFGGMRRCLFPPFGPYFRLLPSCLKFSSVFDFL
jgi:hypothetical protein